MCALAVDQYWPGAAWWTHEQARHNDPIPFHLQTLVALLQTEGITKGEAPTSLTSVESHPNLTSNPDHNIKLWGDGGDARKNAVRITVEIVLLDKNLISWRDYTTLHGMDRATYRRYDAKGGYEARNWWIYLAHVSPEWFKAVDYFDDGKLTIKEQILLDVARTSSSSEEVIKKLGIPTIRDTGRR